MLPKSLFLTKEYKTLEVAHKRLQKKNTLRNVTIFELFKYQTILLAVKHFDNVGYDSKSGIYLWLKKMDSKTWSAPLWTQEHFSELWSKFWPENGILDTNGLLQETQTI